MYWLGNHKKAVTEVAFSPDGQWMASSSDDCTARLWSLAAHPPDASFVLDQHDAVAQTVTFSPDSRRLAVGLHNGTIVVYAVESGEKERELAGHDQSISSLAYSPDGRTLASGSWDNTVRLWSVASEEPAQWSCMARLRGHEGWVLDVAFSPDGRLFSAGDQSVREWDPSAPDMPSIKGQGVAVSSLRFLPDGQLVSIGGPVQTWDPVTLGPAPGVLSSGGLGVSPDGRTVADASDGMVRVRTFGGPERSYPVPENLSSDPGGWVLGNSGLLLKTGRDFHVLGLPDGRWHAAASKPSGEMVCHAAFAANGSLCAATWSDPAGVRFVRYGDRADAGRLLELGPTPDAFVPPVVSHDGRRVLFMEHARLAAAVFDAYTGRRLGSAHGHQQRISGAAFHPVDKTRLVTVGYDDTLRVWDWQRGEELIQLSHPAKAAGGRVPRFTAVTWSLDGKTIATGSSDGTIHLWLSERE